jgi:hypothetical protein
MEDLRPSGALIGQDDEPDGGQLLRDAPADGACLRRIRVATCRTKNRSLSRAPHHEPTDRKRSPSGAEAVHSLTERLPGGYGPKEEVRCSRHHIRSPSLTTFGSPIRYGRPEAVIMLPGRPRTG